MSPHDEDATADLPDRPGDGTGSDRPGDATAPTDDLAIGGIRSPAERAADGGMAPLLAELLAAGLLAPRGRDLLVDDRFRVLGVVGEGGMGVVLRTWDERTDCELAVKLLRPGLAADPDMRRRFIDEAKAMHRVPSHAAVLVVKAVGDEAHPWYATELLEGGSVADRIRTEGPLARDEALAIALAATRALAWIHGEAGLIHRDVKPANVLLDGTGGARLADFGLVRGVGAGAHGLHSGTLGYMPPEVVAGDARDVGFEWDVYGLGATLHEMLAGVPPYAEVVAAARREPGRSAAADLRKAIAAGPPRPVLEVRPDADADLARIAAWAMARERRDRYFRVDDLLADLERAAAGAAPVGPRGDGGAGGAGRAPAAAGDAAAGEVARRTPVVALAAIGLVLVAAVAAAIVVPGILAGDGASGDDTSLRADVDDAAPAAPTRAIDALDLDAHADVFGLRVATADGRTAYPYPFEDAGGRRIPIIPVVDAERVGHVTALLVDLDDPNEPIYVIAPAAGPPGSEAAPASAEPGRRWRLMDVTRGEPDGWVVGDPTPTSYRVQVLLTPEPVGPATVPVPIEGTGAFAPFEALDRGAFMSWLDGATLADRLDARFGARAWSAATLEFTTAAPEA